MQRGDTLFFEVRNMSHQSSRKSPRRRNFFFRYRHKIAPVLLTIAVTAATTTLLTAAIAEIQMRRMTQQPTQAPVATPVATASALQSSSGNQPHAAQPQTQEGTLDLLILVNWNNPAELDNPPQGVGNARSIMGTDILLKSDEMRVDSRAGQAAAEMFRAIRQAGLGELVVSSAYRSQEYQDNLYQKKLRQDPNYGSDPFAKPVSVLPGSCSEHATGLAIDITTRSHPQLEETFANTAEGQWLYQHCWEYGFILRYPKHKESITGVVYEPWHFRYVGKEAAKEIWEQDLCLEEYLRQ